MKNDLASIIITSYNKKKFVIKSIRSALRQTYKEKEVIVYDDASSDGSINDIKNLKGITLVVNNNKKKNTSAINQLNAILEGLKKSKGKYIFLLDGDDNFKKNKLKEIMKHFKKNENLNIIQDKPYLFSKKKVLHFKKKKPFFFYLATYLSHKFNCN